MFGRWSCCHHFEMARRKFINHQHNKQTAPARFVSGGGVSFFGEGLVGQACCGFSAHILRTK